MRFSDAKLGGFYGPLQLTPKPGSWRRRVRVQRATHRRGTRAGDQAEKSGAWRLIGGYAGEGHPSENGTALNLW